MNIHFIQIFVCYFGIRLWYPAIHLMFAHVQKQNTYCTIFKVIKWQQRHFILRVTGILGL